MKPIKIVSSIAEYEAEVRRKLKEGRLEKAPEKAVVMTPETFCKVFSPERIKLLQRICLHEVKSIYQLAKDLGKPYEVVFRNIKYLEGLGLVRIVENGRKRVPRLVGRPLIDLFPKPGVAAGSV